MKVCIVAQFPPPIHGLSMAVDTLYNSSLKSEFHFTRVDISNNRRFLHTLKSLFTSDSDLFYLTLSQSVGGNIRDLIILSILKSRGKKYGVHLHGGLHYREIIDKEMPFWQKKLNFILLGHSEFAITLSPSLNSNFADIVPSNNVFVIGNGVKKKNVPTEAEFKNQLMHRMQEPVRHILFLSNMISSKGYMTVLEMAYLEKMNVSSGNSNRYVFEFAGKFFDEVEKNKFENYVRSHDLADYVKYHGIVKGEKKISLLSSSSIFCLPTSYPMEGQPISIMEAMANGSYIISTKHAAIPDMIDNIKGGKLYTTGTGALKIYSDLQKLSDKQLLEAAVINRHKFESDYTESQYLLNFKQLFQKIERRMF
jgi:glycosyltransferase involved in cell wall biosynthesis